MPTDPEILSSPYVPGDPPPPPPPPGPALETEPYVRPRRIPNIGHTVLFFMVAIIVLLLTSVSAFALVMGLHLLGSETPEKLLREPRLLIPSMAAGYLIAGAIVWAIFTYLWQQPFLQGYYPILMLDQYVKYGLRPTAAVDTGGSIVTKSNIANYFKVNKTYPGVIGA